MSTTKSTNPTPETTPEQNFGQVLKSTREKKGLSIDQVFAELRINKRLLKAFEDNNFSETIDEYSNSVYLRAYLSKYCAFLGLEAYAFEKYGIYPRKKAQVTEVYQGNKHIKAQASFNDKDKPNKARIVFFSLLTLAIFFLVFYVIVHSTGFSFNSKPAQPTTVEELPKVTQPAKVSTANNAKVDNSNSNVNKANANNANKAVNDTNNANIANNGKQATDASQAGNVNNADANSANSEAEKAKKVSEEAKTAAQLAVEKAEKEKAEKERLEKAAKEEKQVEGVPAQGFFFRSRNKGDCWIGIRVNGQWKEMKTVKSGKDFQPKAISASSYRVNVGNMSAVDIYFDGKLLTPPTEGKVTYIVVNNGTVSFE